MIPGTLNRLQHEKSPYLLQHAENPVDWHPWGEEAFTRAKQEDKPVFLSVGYSTCHWCHVMAHESFEDEETAALLNEAFVCVKVDREERPDIDGIYMRVCQMMTGGGGWPLTVVMTPERRPFFAATYIPKESRWGRTGLIALIPQIGRQWRTERERIEAAADRVVSFLQNTVSGSERGEAPGEETLSDAFAELQGQFDAEFGGFGAAPKFPMPHQLLFLLRHGERTGGGEAIRMAEKTLRAMRRGGIFDQLGYGFHRYSTDRQWLVPHFEKMLYDQALCVLSCTEAFQAGGDGEHARTAREVLEYVLRDLHAPEGGFYAAEDADSEGEEGLFYLWGMDEIRRLLGPEKARFAAEIFGLEEGGNFTDPVTGNRTGRNILHLADSEEEAAAGHGISGEALRRRLEEVRLCLLAARAGRVRPRRDEKILADWNGLMIAALARAACVLNEPRYLDEARAAADFVRTGMQTPDGRLFHRWCGGEPAMAGNLDDYAFMIWGLIELYEAGFAARDLRMALELQRILADRFRDPEGGFFFTPDDGEKLLTRLKEGHDGAVPSGNAVTLMNLIRLGRMTGDSRLEEEAAALSRAFAESIRQLPSAHAQWLVALELLAAPSCEVVIAGRPEAMEVIAGRPEAMDTRGLIDVVRRRRHPRPVLLFRPEGETALEIAELAPFTREMGVIHGRAAAYVCSGFSCKRPVTDPEELAAILAAGGKDEDQQRR
ncbi:MAG: thioredoxin domain-containing protein [Deltaproteobacteria bacterium]|nr:thioredoxin domain-containing protein [Deltaproteobacteria bacterium]